MSIDLSIPLTKVTEESERVLQPEATFGHAKEVFAQAGIELSYQLWSHGDFCWTASFSTDFSYLIPSGFTTFRAGGKGGTREQCLASLYMEFAERLSLCRYAARVKGEHRCIDLRTGEELQIGAIDLHNSMCVSAGNIIEEAILHSLHELIETRIQHTCFWQPFKLVPLKQLMPDLPDWVHRTVAVIRTPSEQPVFHHFTALRYVKDQMFDERTSEYFIRRNGRLYTVKPERPRNYHSPNSGSAASLNPAAAVVRAIGESFQGDGKDITTEPLRQTVAGTELVTGSEFENHETGTINGDILKILGLIPDDVFIGYIDVTDPVFGIPVVRLVSDYDPRRSLASREIISKLFAV